MGVVGAVEDWIERVRRDARVVVEDHANAWRVTIRAEPVGIAVTVPHTVLEWFVDAVDAGTREPVWRDWVDHYDVDGSSAREALEEEMAASLDTCVTRLLEARLRIAAEDSSSRRKVTLEWSAGGHDWKPLAVADLLAE